MYIAPNFPGHDWPRTLWIVKLEIIPRYATVQYAGLAFWCHIMGWGFGKRKKMGRASATWTPVQEHLEPSLIFQYITFFQVF